MGKLRVQIEEAGYEGRSRVISDIAFTVGEGELVGLIGPNGAGKSTTIKAVLGLLKDVKGKVEFPGGSPNYAYIPEHPVLYDELTLWEHLRLAASAFGLDDATFEERANELLERFRLTGAKHDLPTGFSKGMQQKLMLIIGFIHEPELYIVDEPFIGLDPRAIREFLEMLDSERKRGAGVLMSTHVLDTAERICSSFLLVNEGKLIASGELQDIRDKCGLPGASLFDCFHALT
ncbi:ABC transporter ATP-binding protein [Paenibacillus sp. YN15]|uniref:ABC transporter ATP-binding protein n=1 Tax=Paenibacillus sp. YN15 TaxID=1742774 RepID=UPI000DCD4D31|nr:ABC transporter ATP-binding protein [Paenibacillus sp. YN15]RAU95699.1 ABC transporter ATP-binding protein [Paenibacillus sp. YN15]